MQEQIIKKDISDEMKWRYLYYAMDVIEDRALPDIRDGFKPIHRRILFATYDLGITPEKGYKKCARIVGEVLGKYHPHGDQSAYSSLVRMAQDFNMRYTLIDGHGNYGSIDGDSAAAMRYTEARMQKISMELFKDINKNTVDFIPNFDGEEKEPSVLPSRFPNFLVNGSIGIAVGMATSVPPHNLNETINSIIYQIDNPNCDIKDLNKILTAPDFPTGGIIVNPNKMLELYETGRGSVELRGKYHIENNAKTKLIVFTEIPYQSNKMKICQNISDLVIKKDKVLQSIVDVRDESDREGMRLVIEVKTTENINKILARLFQKTKLQNDFSVTLRAIADNRPKILNLKDINMYYINHQKEILTRRTQFDLDKSLKKLHILEGLRIAILNMDKAIELIRTSKSKNEARENLIFNLSLDEEQANAVLKLELQRLTGLEIETIQVEHDELIKNVDYLNSILNNEKELLNLLKNELIEIKDKYGDERKTKLIYEDTIEDITEDDLIEDNTVTIVLTKHQYLKKTLKYSENQTVKDGDEVVQILQTSNKKDLLMFTNQGRVFTRKIYELTGKVECTPSALGEFIPNILKENLQKDEKIIYIASPENYDKGYMLYIFENNNIVKMTMKPYETKTNRQVAQDAFNTDSPLKYIKYIPNDIDILTLSSEGKMLIQDTEGINPKTSNGGKKSQGNSFVKLDDNSLVGVVFEPKEDDIIRFKTEKKDCVEINLADICQNSKDKINYYNHCKGRKGNTGSFVYNCRQKNDRIIELIK